MKGPAIALGLAIAGWAIQGAAGEHVPIGAPGLAPARMDFQGRLIEDWGTVGVRLTGEGVTEGPTAVQAVQLDGLVPAAQAAADRGAVRMVSTAFRAPAWPSGVDVLCVRVEEAKGRAAQVTVALEVPAAAKIGLKSVAVEKRLVLAVPNVTLETQDLRDWGATSDAAAMAGWAKPEGKCDPAFRNIRAGMGGMPIRYRFQVAPGSRANVVLGFCESHWTKAGKRPLLCRVEGAPPREIDAVAEWGQHKPGVLVFRAHDVDADGKLEVAVGPMRGAADRNTILNAIWLFPPGAPPDSQKVIAGELSAKALRYVDVGGKQDQSIYPSGKLEYRLTLPPAGAKELYFYLACPGGAAPVSDLTAWTPEGLRQAALAVWRDWRP